MHRMKADAAVRSCRAAPSCCSSGSAAPPRLGEAAVARGRARPCWLRAARGGCARAGAEARNSGSGHGVVRRLLMVVRVTAGTW